MKIFLSYPGSIEEQMLARIIGDRLEHFGHDVSINFRGIPGGDNWKQETEAAIRDVDWFVALISRNYESSSRVKWQLLSALENEKPILPVTVEAVDHMPPLLEHLQPVDISGDLNDGIERINALLQTRTQPERTDEPAPSAAIFKEERQRILDTPEPDRVFVAYSRRQRALAQDLAELLVENGKAVFYDAKIHAGATWRQTIQKALDDATHLVVIWTPEAAQSDEVEREVSYALAEGKAIIPVLSQEIPRLPYHLHGLQYIVLDADLKSIETDLLRAFDQYSEDESIWK
jgi:hypothetical protein